MSPIGIFDSGVGGLTVFQAVERALPDEALIYLGDTARVPYGIRSAETVLRYSLEAAQFMSERQVKLLIVACNTASSVAIEALSRHMPFPVLGVIEPGARRAVELSASGRIGVIGTRATIASEAYTRAIHALRPDAQVVPRACPLFVPLAEEGWTDDAIARQVAQRYLAEFASENVDVLVLGCTHYPLLRQVIGEVMGAGVTLVDSAETVAAEARAMLQATQATAEPAQSNPDHHFFVTDVPGPFKAVAERFLGHPIPRLERTHIE